MADRASTELAADQIITPSNDMGTAHGAEFFRPGNAGENG
jgi:hypothetical protein